jgi:hypothetical protein
VSLLTAQRGVSQAILQAGFPDRPLQAFFDVPHERQRRVEHASEVLAERPPADELKHEFEGALSDLHGNRAAARRRQSEPDEQDRSGRPNVIASRSALE